LVAALAITGCGSDPSDPDAPRATALAIRSGNEQSGPAGGVLPLPLAATATDAAQNPVPGALVRFRVTRGASTGTTVADTVVVAGFDGAAVVELRLGTAIDTSVVEASLQNAQNAIARFRAVATPPPRLDGVVPATFAAGDTVRLRGQFFDATPASNTAFVGTARARVVAGAADTSLTVVVPPCVPAGQVTTRLMVGTVTTNAVQTTMAGATRVTALRPLEGITVSGADLSTCIQLAGGGASYLLVPNGAAQSNGSRVVDFALAVNGSVLGAETASPVVVPAPPHLEPEPSSIARRFDLALRTREAALVDAARADGTLRPIPNALARVSAAAAPPVGSQRMFHVLSKFDGSAFKRITARLQYAGDHILLYVDVDQPPGAFTDAELKTFGDLFDDTLYDIDVRAFGSESDIDANGRIIFVLTPVVNAMTSAADCSASGFITGFHYGLDLLPSQTNSNRGEIFYALVPDLGGTRSCEHTKAEVERLVPATFVHEFQHMISFGQHVVARGAGFETLWLNEGLSHIAEELAGRTYELKFPAPLGRADPSQLFPDSAQGYVTPLMRNAQRFLEAPGTVSATAGSGGGSLAERGGGWLFLRWLGDVKGEAIYGRLVQTSRTGIGNVEDRANESFGALFGDFVTAIYTDSLPGVARTAIPARLRFNSRNFRRIFQRFADIDQSGGTPPFPFTPSSVSVGQTVTGSMTLGSMSYYRLATAPADPGVSIRFSRPGSVPFAIEDNVQISIFRLP
jgi:hypothetical protein